MLRTDYSLMEREVTISSAALVAAVLRRLEKRSLTTALDAFARIDDSGLLEDFAKLRTELAIVQNRKIDLDESLQDRIDKIMTKLDDEEGNQPEAAQGVTDTRAIGQRLAEFKNEQTEAAAGIASLRAVARKVQETIDTAAAFVTSATATPAAGYPAIIAAAIRERLHRHDEAGITHVLYVSSIAAGGETITRHSLWRRSGVVVFLGGSQLSHLILDLSTNKVTGDSSAWTAHVRYDLKKNEFGSLVVKQLTEANHLK